MKYTYEIKRIDLLKNHVSVPAGGYCVLHNPTEHYSAYHDWHECELEELLNQLARDGWEVVSIEQDLLSGKSLAGNILLKRPSKK